MRLMITALSIGFSVVIREYFIVSVFTSLWPIAWWSTVHYWQQPYNLLIGLVLLGLCALLVFVCDRIYQSFRNMIALNWERETIAPIAPMTPLTRDEQAAVVAYAERVLTWTPERQAELADHASALTGATGKPGRDRLLGGQRVCPPAR